MNSVPLSLPNAFPYPPAIYYNQYTDENVSRGRAPPPPPIPPKGDSFLIFNAPQWNDDHIVRPLESLNIRRLYPQHFDRKRELRKALHSILATFLDLIDTLVKCPRSTKRNEKLEDINLLFIHMQHLLNEYRVHQARDMIRTMLEVQRRQTLEITDRLNFHIEKVTEIVAGCAGTSTSDQNQRSLTSNLKWEIASLQAKLAEISVIRSKESDGIAAWTNGSDAVLCELTHDYQLDQELDRFPVTADSTVAPVSPVKSSSEMTKPRNEVFVRASKPSILFSLAASGEKRLNK